MAYKNKEKELRTRKKYYQNNREKILRNKKIYYRKNKEKLQKRLRLNSQKWYQRNREKIQALHRKYYRKNKIKVKIYHKKWYKENKERLLELSRKYYQGNKRKVQRRHRNYNRNNKKRFLLYKKGWQRYKRKTDPRYRLDENMGTAVWVSLKNRKAGQKWEILVSYTLEDLIKHLEKQFDNKMSWNNYGSYWAVDHIKPKSLFRYTSSDNPEFKECWSLNNLQPLEKIKNIKKNNLYIV